MRWETERERARGEGAAERKTFPRGKFCVSLSSPLCCAHLGGTGISAVPVSMWVDQVWLYVAAAAASAVPFWWAIKPQLTTMG